MSNSSWKQLETNGIELIENGVQDIISSTAITKGYSNFIRQRKLAEHDEFEEKILDHTFKNVLSLKKSCVMQYFVFKFLRQFVIVIVRSY